MSTNLPIARYYLVIDRDVIEDDFSVPYANGCGNDGTIGSDGTYESAVAQLVGELQEGWDDAGIAGSFHVVGRELLDTYSDLSEAPVPDAEWWSGWPQESNPEPYLWPAAPTPEPGPTKLAVTLNGRLKRPECTGDGTEMNDHNGDTCPICEDEDSPWFEGDVAWEGSAPLDSAGSAG